ncbi:MAG: 16S rRNA (cytosine(1402)-N(4))-methyltransferase RsmH [Acidobacteriota bacterium]
MELHRPVMLSEVLSTLKASEGGTFVDATLGMGGHSEGILQASPDSRVIGFDRDSAAIELAKARLAPFGHRFSAIHTDYRQLGEVLDRLSIPSVDGILADLGVSSWQLDSPDRGFSFRFGTEPLDMRMDQSEGQTAADLVNRLSEGQLADIIWQFGEERGARRIARRLVNARAQTPVKTTGELADIVVRALNQKGHWRIHPATRTFQALRIAVNRELDGLDDFVVEAIDRLTNGRRLVIITFQSLEDRIIKQTLRRQAGQCICPPIQPACVCGAKRKIELITRKALTAGEEEIEGNPRARSAKLRACIKL